MLKSLSNHARVNQPCKQCHKVPGLIARWGSWLVRVRVQRERGHSGLKEGWEGLKDEAVCLRFEEERKEERRGQGF